MRLFWGVSLNKVIEQEASSRARKPWKSELVMYAYGLTIGQLFIGIVMRRRKKNSIQGGAVIYERIPRRCEIHKKQQLQIHATIDRFGRVEITDPVLREQIERTCKREQD